MNPKNTERTYAISLMELFTLIRKRIWMLLAVCLLSGGICFLVCNVFIHPTYEADATMSVITRFEDNIVVTNDQITSAENLVDTYAVVIRSRSVLKKVIRNLELDMSYETLKGKVIVTAVNGTQVMEIKVRDHDPELAEDILREITAIAPDEIIRAVEAGAVRIIDEAEAKGSKVAPHTGLNTVLAMMLGGMACIAYLVISFLLNDTYLSEEELQDDLDIPVFGVIPLLNSKSANAGKYGRKV